VYPDRRVRIVYDTAVGFGRWFELAGEPEPSHLHPIIEDDGLPMR